MSYYSDLVQEYERNASTEVCADSWTAFNCSMSSVMLSSYLAIIDRVWGKHASRFIGQEAPTVFHLTPRADEFGLNMVKVDKPQDLGVLGLKPMVAASVLAITYGFFCQDRQLDLPIEPGQQFFCFGSVRNNDLRTETLVLPFAQNWELLGTKVTAHHPSAKAVTAAAVKYLSLVIKERGDKTVGFDEDACHLYNTTPKSLLTTLVYYMAALTAPSVIGLLPQPMLDAFFAAAPDLEPLPNLIGYEPNLWAWWQFKATEDDFVFISQLYAAAARLQFNAADRISLEDPEGGPFTLKLGNASFVSDGRQVSDSRGRQVTSHLVVLPEAGTYEVRAEDMCVLNCYGSMILALVNNTVTLNTGKFGETGKAITDAYLSMDGSEENEVDLEGDVDEYIANQVRPLFIRGYLPLRVEQKEKLGLAFSGKTHDWYVPAKSLLDAGAFEHNLARMHKGTMVFIPTTLLAVQSRHLPSTEQRRYVFKVFNSVEPNIRDDESKLFDTIGKWGWQESMLFLGTNEARWAWVEENFATILSIKINKLTKRIGLEFANHAVVKNGEPAAFHNYTFNNDVSTGWCPRSGYFPNAIGAPGQVVHVPGPDGQYAMPVAETVNLMDATLGISKRVPTLELLPKTKDGFVESKDGQWTVYSFVTPPFINASPQNPVAVVSLDAEGAKQYLFAEQPGYLRAVRWRTENYGDTVSVNVRCEFPNYESEAKFRSGLKGLATRFPNGESLVHNEYNAARLEVDLIAFGDSIKCLDLVKGMLPVAAQTLRETPAGRQLIAEANALLDVANEFTLEYHPLLDVLGEYQAIKEYFNNNYGRAVWFKQFDVAKGIHRALCALYSNKAKDKVDGWYFVAPADRHVLDPASGKYFDDATLFPAELTLLADGPLDSPTTEILAWSPDTTLMLQRSYGWVGIEGKPVKSIQLVEVSTVRQSVSGTSVMAGLARGVEIRGDHKMARLMMAEHAKHRAQFLAYQAMQRGATINGLPIVQLADSNGTLLSGLLNTEELETLVSNPANQPTLLKQLAEKEVFRSCVFAFTTGKTDGKFSIYLPAIVSQDPNTNFKGVESLSGLVLRLIRAIVLNPQGKTDIRTLQMRIRKALDSFARSKGMRRKLTRGAAASTCKFTGVPGIPVDELWIKESDAYDSFYQETLRDLRVKPKELDGLKVISFRQPLSLPAPAVVRVITPDHPAYGWMNDVLGYQNPLVCYLTRSDYDGDNFNITNGKGSTLALPTYHSIIESLQAVIGADPLGARCDVYIADHYKKGRKLSGLTKKNITFLRSACGSAAEESRCLVTILKRSTEFMQVAIDKAHHVGLFGEITVTMAMAIKRMLDRGEFVSALQGFAPADHMLSVPFTEFMAEVYENALGGYGPEVYELVINNISAMMRGRKRRSEVQLTNEHKDGAKVTVSMPELFDKAGLNGARCSEYFDIVGEAASAQLSEWLDDFKSLDELPLVAQIILMGAHISFQLNKANFYKFWKHKETEEGYVKVRTAQFRMAQLYLSYFEEHPELYAALAEESVVFANLHSYLTYVFPVVSAKDGVGHVTVQLSDLGVGLKDEDYPDEPTGGDDNGGGGLPPAPVVDGDDGGAAVTADAQDPEVARLIQSLIPPGMNCSAAPVVVDVTAQLAAEPVAVTEAAAELAAELVANVIDRAYDLNESIYCEVIGLKLDGRDVAETLYDYCSYSESWVVMQFLCCAFCPEWMDAVDDGLAKAMSFDGMTWFRGALFVNESVDLTCFPLTPEVWDYKYDLPASFDSREAAARLLAWATTKERLDYLAWLLDQPLSAASLLRAPAPTPVVDVTAQPAAEPVAVTTPQVNVLYQGDRLKTVCYLDPTQPAEYYFDDLEGYSYFVGIEFNYSTPVKTGLEKHYPSSLKDMMRRGGWDSLSYLTMDCDGYDGELFEKLVELEYNQAVESIRAWVGTLPANKLVLYWYDTHAPIFVHEAFEALGFKDFNDTEGYWLITKDDGGSDLAPTPVPAPTPVVEVKAPTPQAPVVDDNKEAYQAIVPVQEPAPVPVPVPTVNKPTVPAGAVSFDNDTRFLNGSADQQLVIRRVFKMLEAKELDCINLLGRAGSGKTYTVQLITKLVREYLPGVKVLIVAPTGVAAQNADGCTWQSLFRVGGNYQMLMPREFPDYADAGAVRPMTINCMPRVPKAQQYLIIVDEVSMVAAEDLVRMWEIANTNISPTGVHWLLTGDLRQLPPVDANRPPRSYVNNPYANAKFENNLGEVAAYGSFFGEGPFPVQRKLRWRAETWALVTNWRQGNAPEFANALNALGEGKDLNNHEVALLNTRFVGDNLKIPSGDHVTHIYPTNKEVMDCNHEAIARIAARGAETRTYHAMVDAYLGGERVKGQVESYTMEGKVGTLTVNGREYPMPKFIKDLLPIEPVMTLAVGAPFMVRQNMADKGVFNGTVGTITALHADRIVINVEGESVTLNLFEHKADRNDTKVSGEVIKQLPGHPSAAITSIKVQGLTINNPVVVNFHGRTAGLMLRSHGALYVALSRVTRPELLFINMTRKLFNAACHADEAAKAVIKRAEANTNLLLGKQELPVIKVEDFATLRQTGPTVNNWYPITIEVAGHADRIQVEVINDQVTGVNGPGYALDDFAYSNEVLELVKHTTNYTVEFLEADEVNGFYHYCLSTGDLSWLVSVATDGNGNYELCFSQDATLLEGGAANRWVLAELNPDHPAHAAILAAVAQQLNN